VTAWWLKLYAQPRLIAILLLGFSSGLPLALTGATLYIRLADIGVDRTTIGLFGAVAIPYALKFLWSPLVDGAPLLLLTRVFGQRRGWMIAAQAVLMIAIAAMGIASPNSDGWYFALLAVCVAIASATQDIAIDAYRVEILDDEQQPRGAAMVTLGYRIAMVVSGAGALYLAEFFNWHVAYLTMAAIMAVGMVTVLCSPEPLHEDGQNRAPMQAKGFLGYVALLMAVGASLAYVQTRHALVVDATMIFPVIILGFVIARFYRRPAKSGWLAQRVVAPFSEFMQRERWWLLLLFVIVYKLGDAFLGIMTGPFLLDIGFAKTDIANVVKLYGFVATVIGSFLGAALVDRIGMFRALFLCGLLQGLTNLVFLLQAHAGANIGVLVLSISLENLCGGMGTAVFVAFISLLCRKQYTATQYALFSSLASIARTMLSTSAGYASVQLGWEAFFVLSAVLAIPGLLVLWLLGKKEISRPRAR
jgi:PAT family beta-lactamase induction signal transducer AmpG